MTQSVTKVIVTDGGPAQLAAAILCLGYGNNWSENAAADLKARLGLNDVKAHNVETAFSYPNGAALVTENGRTGIYLFDSDQEVLTVGSDIRRLDPVEVTPLPPDGTATQTLPTAVAPADPALAEPAPADPVPADPVPAAPDPATAAAVDPVTPPVPATDPVAVAGAPVDPASPVTVPPAGDAPAVTGTSDIAPLPGVTEPVVPADPVAPAGAGALPPEAAGDQPADPAPAADTPTAVQVSAEGDGQLPAAASGNTPSPDYYAAYNEGVAAAQALQLGETAPANPYGEDFPQKRDGWSTGFMSVPAPGEATAAAAPASQG